MTRFERISEERKNEPVKKVVAVTVRGGARQPHVIPYLQVITEQGIRALSVSCVIEPDIRAFKGIPVMVGDRDFMADRLRECQAITG